jgi:hypothetical protein
VRALPRHGKLTFVAPDAYVQLAGQVASRSGDRMLVDDGEAMDLLEVLMPCGMRTAAAWLLSAGQPRRGCPQIIGLEHRRS